MIGDVRKSGDAGTGSGAGAVRVALARPLSYLPIVLMLGCITLAPIGVIAVVGNWPYGWTTTLHNGALGFLPFCALLFWLWRRKWDLRDWSTVPFLEFQGGRITVIPAPRFVSNAAPSQFVFPQASHLEYHVETGDALFENDRAQVLRYTLWAVHPDGSRVNLPLGDVTGVQQKAAAENLRSVGVELHVVRVYDGQHGEHDEADVTATSLPRSDWQIPVRVMAAMSSLWLGCLVGLFVQSIALTVLIGVLAFATLTSLELFAAESKRMTFLSLALAVPSYALTYVVVVIALRSITTK